MDAHEFLFGLGTAIFSAGVSYGLLRGSIETLTVRVRALEDHIKMQSTRIYSLNRRRDD